MIGIFGFMAEQKVDGAVPLLKGVVSHYDGEVRMVTYTIGLGKCIYI